MIQQGYEIDIAPDHVELRHDGTTTPLDERIVPGILMCGLAVVMFTAMLFLPGKHNRPSVWDDLHTYHWPSGDFVAALIMTVFIAVPFGSVFLLGFRQFFPSGEELHCDGSTLAVAKIAWYNLLGQWKRRSFPLSSVSEFTYAFLRSSKYGDVYGLTFRANEKDRKVFTGIEAPEADKVIKGLKALGVNVIENQDMPSRIEETMRKRASLASGGI